MQALHAMFAVGALIGPAVIGLLGYRPALRWMCISLLYPTMHTTVSGIIRVLRPNDRPKDGLESPGAAEAVEAALQQAGRISDQGSSDKALSAGDDAIVSQIASSDDAQPDAAGLGGAGVPPSVRVLITLFFFVYVGIEVGFAGWVPTYALLTEATDSESKAAYLSSLFFVGLALGRIVSVPLSIYLSTKVMIRSELTISVVGSLLVFFFSSGNYEFSTMGCFAFGAGLGSLFPMMLIMVNDYGFVA
jgi:fucose permease